MKKKTLVLGASLKEHRYSNIAIKRLVNYNHEVKAFGLREGEVAGVSVDKRLLNYEDIDTVTLYLNPKHQEAYYDYIIGLNPKRVIFNPGTENLDFYKLLLDNNIEYEVACTLVLLGTKQY
ncbi:MAG: CoA-binding protein [Winogradskyella sp.]|uniref:CoA-binding protein n=1 Tax=Winogradskyella sp. TaxID=1883156 RepID=UPI001843560F|nr:CoA-binding protein [Winogradskyella sp.]MBT8244678.1 CoA-binding protein [Winogradskyella sp.]NNK22649.1 CoA-binding protein [Winogradskyella sp.]